MNAPLARHLIRFASATITEVRLAPVASEPMVQLLARELEAHLEAARRETRAAADLAHGDAIAALASEREAALSQSIAAARADWCATEAAAIAARVEGAFATLRDDLAERIARVLRPLMAEAVHERTVSALCEALERLLADPARAPIAVRGPADLVAAIRARAPDLGVELVVAETVEAVVVADGAWIETRLGAALTALADAEH